MTGLDRGLNGVLGEVLVRRSAHFCLGKQCPTQPKSNFTGTKSIDVSSPSTVFQKWHDQARPRPNHQTAELCATGHMQHATLVHRAAGAQQSVTCVMKVAVDEAP